MACEGALPKAEGRALEMGETKGVVIGRRFLLGRCHVSLPILLEKHRCPKVKAGDSYAWVIS